VSLSIISTCRQTAHEPIQDGKQIKHDAFSRFQAQAGSLKKK